MNNTSTMRPRFKLPATLALALAPVLAGGLWGGVALADEPTHEIQKATPPATVGVPGKVSVTVQGKNGWHVNEDAPITLTAKSEAGVDLPKAKLARADLAQSSKQSARFDIPYAASATGKKTITAEARFVMCQEQACKPVKETVTLELDVAAAPAGGTTSAPAGKTKRSGKPSSAP